AAGPTKHLIKNAKQTRYGLAFVRMHAKPSTWRKFRRPKGTSASLTHQITAISMVAGLDGRTGNADPASFVKELRRLSTPDVDRTFRRVYSPPQRFPSCSPNSKEATMLFRKALWALAVVAGLLTPMAVRAQSDYDYLDVYIAKVKPEKIAEFEALNKKWADANRRFHGDTWLALESVYGEGNVYQFTSTRKDDAEVQSVEDLQMAALTKAFGKEAALKMEQDFQNCLVWSRSELRRRRWDLSRKPPAGDAYSKLLGESRYLRTTAVHIRAGHVADFEALLKDLKEAGERNPNTAPVFVSQVVEGGKGTTFYVTTLRSSLGGFDRNPTTREILGDEGYKKYLQ